MYSHAKLRFTFLNFVTLPGILSVKLLTQFSSSRPSRFLPFASLKQKHRSGLQFPPHSAQALCCRVMNENSPVQGCFLIMTLPGIEPGLTA